MYTTTAAPASPRRRAARQWTLAAAALGTALAAAPALALNFEFGDGAWVVDWDTTFSYAAMWRVAKQDKSKFSYRDTGDLLADSTRYTLLINADDGNYNFSRSMVQNKASVVSELNLAWRNYGLFARGRAYYDEVYNQNTDQSESAYLTYNSGELYGGDAGFQEFPKGTRDEHRQRLEMLDYFAFTSGELPGERLYDLRLGSQVINWGVSTFFQGINGLQNRADAIAANTPGVEVKEILLPTGAIYGQVDLIQDVTFEAYYQYEWRKTELNGVGSYFSDRDFLGPGAENFLVAVGDRVTFVAPRTPDEAASNSGQWGSALHWITDGGTDFGLYYVKAHSKAPAYQLNTVDQIPRSYNIVYFENLEGYAASFATVLADTNVQGEVSWTQGAPVVLQNGDPEEGDVLAAQLGGSMVLEPTRFWDDASVVFEFAGTWIESHDNEELRYDDKATAMALRAEFAYINVASGLDLKVPLFLQYTFDGTILESRMAEEATTFNIGLKAIYLNNFTAQIGYTNYFDGGANNLLTDRDNVSFNMSYSF
ncbi:MAG: DUF1302 family protein [Pseudomonadales bacterium]|nr:DUF1302 family protein [Pseudomonadales bacterium]